MQKQKTTEQKPGALAVVLRRERGRAGEFLALFPSMLASYEQSAPCEALTRDGHTSADYYTCIARTRPARVDEPGAREFLERAGYMLRADQASPDGERVHVRVIRRTPHALHAARYREASEALRKMREHATANAKPGRAFASVRPLAELKRTSRESLNVACGLVNGFGDVVSIGCGAFGVLRRYTYRDERAGAQEVSLCPRCAPLVEHASASA